MGCTPFSFPGGGGYVCSRGPKRTTVCKFCNEPIRGAVLLCDWKLTGTKAGKTCDAPMCRRCAAAVGADKDLCPPHKRVWDADPRNPARKPSG